MSDAAAWVAALSAAATALVAWHGIRLARNEAKSRAAFDFFSGWFQSPESIANRDDYIKLLRRFRSKGMTLGQAFKQGKLTSNDEVVLDRYLSSLEGVSISIRLGGLSEQFCYRMFRSIFLRDWEIASPYVFAVREEEEAETGRKSRFYVELETLVSRWQTIPPDQPLNAVENVSSGRLIISLLSLIVGAPLLVGSAIGLNREIAEESAFSVWAVAPLLIGLALTAFGLVVGWRALVPELRVKS